MLSLTLTLRAIAILLLLLIVFGYFASGEVLIKQFIAANVLFILSIFGPNSEKRIAVISLLLAVIIPIGIIQSFLLGKISIEFVIINGLMFIYLAIVSIGVIVRR